MIAAGVLRARLRMTRNAFIPPRRRGTPRTGGNPWVGVLITAVVMWIFHAAFAQAFAATGPDVRGAGTLLGLALTGTVTALLVFDTQVALSTLLLDRDLERLRSAPIRAGVIVLLKLADALPRTSAPLITVTLPALLAFASAYELPLWALALLPIHVAGLWAIPLGFGVALGLELIRWIPAPLARGALGLFSTAMFAVVWLSLAFALPGLLEAGASLSASWSVGDAQKFLPGGWTGLALVAAHLGDPGEALGWTVLVAGAATISVSLAHASASRRLDRALAGVAATTPARSPSRPVSIPRRGDQPRGPVRAIAVRDALLFSRDWTVLGDVLVTAGLWMLLPLLGAPLGFAEPPVLARTMIVALAAGLGYEVAGRSVPFERGGLIWSRLAPVAPWRWLAGKLVSGAILMVPLVLVGILVLSAGLKLGLADSAEVMAAGFAATILALSAGIWTGLAFGDQNWVNPRAMLSVSGRLLAILLLLAQAAVWLAFFAVSDAHPSTQWEFRLVAPALAALLSWVPCAASARLIRTRDWPG